MTGIYHPGSNRLVLYDYATNGSFLAARKGAAAAAGKAGGDALRLGRSVAFDPRLARPARRRERQHGHARGRPTSCRSTAACSTGPATCPAWLAEGLAVYCESSVDGAWQGIGEPNPRRARLLAVGAGKLFTVRRLAESDDWLRKSSSVERVVLGYSQSWLLFRLLMQEKPKKLKAYLETIKPRKGPGNRLADFVEAFGDLKKLEARYAAYAVEIARREGKQGGS